MTIPNAPRLGTCRQAMRKAREKRKRELSTRSASPRHRRTTCSIFRFRRIFMDSVRSRDEDSYKGRASFRRRLRRATGNGDPGIRLRRRTVPGARCKHTETRSLELPDTVEDAADQECASLPRSLSARSGKSRKLRR